MKSSDTTKIQNFTDRYTEGLDQYLHGAGETALQQAYELGRSAIANGLGVLDMSRIYQQALTHLDAGTTSARPDDAVRAANFLGESLSPFEMTHRGFQEIIAALEERSQELARLNEELEQSLSILRATLDATADGILVIGRDGTVESFNHRFQEMWHLDSPLRTTEEVNVALAEILSQVHDPEQFLNEIRDFSLAGDGHRLITVATKDGKIFECHSIPQRMGKNPGRVWSFRDVTARRRAEEALRALAKRVVEIQEEERQRVSRELHDDVCQRLTAIKLHMELFEDDIKKLPSESTEQFTGIKKQVSEAITSVRRISSNLRPAALDDFGLVIALQHLCAEFEKLHNLKIAFHTTGFAPNRYNTHTETALYRIAQEALSNIAKHAEAKNVSMKLSNPVSALVALDVEDTGKGFEMERVQNHKSPRRGMGLISMKERSELLGGTFRIESKPRKGTKIHVEIPVTQ